MKYLPKEPAAKLGENKDNYSEPQFYTKNKDGQWELYPPPTTYQRVLAFLKDLRKK